MTRPSRISRDLLWLVLGGVLIAWALPVVFDLPSHLGDVLRNPAARSAWAGIAFAVGYGVAAAWIAVGAWRRTVWGCPFEHDNATRRCPRHEGQDATEAQSS